MQKSWEYGNFPANEQACGLLVPPLPKEGGKRRTTTLRGAAPGKRGAVLMEDLEEREAAAQAERLRPLVNEILARFNEEGITTEEAGLVVLALTHRLMTVLEGHPDEQRAFIVRVVNFINRFLAGEFRED